jgi:hypothetical protein
MAPSVFRKAASIPDHLVAMEDVKHVPLACETCRLGVERGFGKFVDESQRHVDGLFILPGTLSGDRLAWLCHLLECDTGMADCWGTLTFDGRYEFESNEDVLHLGNSLIQAKQLAELRGDFVCPDVVQLNAFLSSLVERDAEETMLPVRLDEFDAGLSWEQPVQLAQAEEPDAELERMQDLMDQLFGQE